jgi:hypothetical protein
MKIITFIKKAGITSLTGVLLPAAVSAALQWKNFYCQLPVSYCRTHCAEISQIPGFAVKV